MSDSAKEDSAIKATPPTDMRGKPVVEDQNDAPNDAPAVDLQADPLGIHSEEGSAKNPVAQITVYAAAVGAEGMLAGDVQAVGSVSAHNAEAELRAMLSGRNVHPNYVLFTIGLTAQVQMLQEIIVSNANG